MMCYRQIRKVRRENRKFRRKMYLILVLLLFTDRNLPTEFGCFPMENDILSTYYDVSLNSVGKYVNSVGKP